MSEPTHKIFKKTSILEKIDHGKTLKDRRREKLKHVLAMYSREQRILDEKQAAETKDLEERFVKHMADVITDPLMDNANSIYVDIKYSVDTNFCVVIDGDRSLPFKMHDFKKMINQEIRDYHPDAVFEETDMGTWRVVIKESPPPK